MGFRARIVGSCAKIGQICQNCYVGQVLNSISPMVVPGIITKVNFLPQHCLAVWGTDTVNVDEKLASAFQIGGSRSKTHSNSTFLSGQWDWLVRLRRWGFGQIMLLLIVVTVSWSVTFRGTPGSELEDSNDIPPHPQVLCQLRGQSAFLTMPPVPSDRVTLSVLT